MRFAVVTPIRNGARFIDEAIASVVTQAGDFTIRYHVQDGGSTDGTLSKLERWQSRLAGDFPMLCRKIEFSYASASDRGLYDAINHGFAACGEAEIMSWINSDDRFEPAAFVTAATIFTRFAEISWLCGRYCLLDIDGAMTSVSDPRRFPKSAITAGLYDGRSLRGRPFLQQEGMFWRQSLWHKAGGLNTSFRLAGDFDLWRRFSRHADLVAVDTVLGAHRAHPEQLTSSKLAYIEEARRSVSPEDRKKARRRDRRSAPLLERAGKQGWTYAPPATLLQFLWRGRKLLPERLSVRRILQRNLMRQHSC